MDTNSYESESENEEMCSKEQNSNNVDSILSKKQKNTSYYKLNRRTILDKAKKSQKTKKEKLKIYNREYYLKNKQKKN